MTERLRDLVDAEDPALAELARLVRATGDLDPQIGAQERVRLRLAESRQRRRRVLRPLLVVLVLVVATPVVIAGVREFVVPALAPTRATPPVTASEPRTVERAPSGLRSQTSQDRPAPTLAPDTAQGSAAPEVPRLRERPPAPGAARGPAPTEASAPPTVAERREPEATAQDVADSPGRPAVDLQPDPQPVRSAEPPAEAERVLRALRLLRHDRDAIGALRELDRYRARFPDGDLAEEALALSMEARAALDDRAARVLAEQYLRQFPRGRFRALAEVIQRRFHER